MPSKKTAAHIGSMGGKAAGSKWERKSSEPEVDAAAEGEVTPIGTYALPDEFSVVILMYHVAF